ncbi:MAG TPA: thioredoxin [Victivallales bacterium]|nr:thioredoxin [Victivallales bacterium]
MSEIAHLNDSNFEEKTAEGITLIDFWAPWCGPCKMLGPILDEIAEEIGDKALIAKVNVDDSPGIAQKFSVRSIPAIFIMKDGVQVKQFIGVQKKQALISALEEVAG